MDKLTISPALIHTYTRWSCPEQQQEWSFNKATTIKMNRTNYSRIKMKNGKSNGKSNTRILDKQKTEFNFWTYHYVIGIVSTCNMYLFLHQLVHIRPLYVMWGGENTVDKGLFAKYINCTNIIVYVHNIISMIYMRVCAYDGIYQYY